MILAFTFASNGCQTNVAGASILRNAGIPACEEGIMTTESEYRPVRLERRQFIELVNGAGISVTCVSGLIWLTQHKQYADVVLAPGRSFVLDRMGKAVVQALVPSTVRLTRPLQVNRVARVVAALKNLLSPVEGVKQG